MALGYHELLRNLQEPYWAEMTAIAFLNYLSLLLVRSQLLPQRNLVLDLFDDPTTRAARGRWVADGKTTYFRI